MAEATDEIINQLGQGVSSTISSVYSIIIWIIIIGILAGAIYFLLYRGSFKHIIVLKKLTDTNSRKIVMTDNYKYVKTSKGELFIKLLNARLSLPIPPPSAINSTKKGKEHVVAYLSGVDEIIYLKDTIDNEKELAEKGFFQPLTTTQRQLLTHQFEVAYNRNKSTLKEIILPAISIIALVVVIIVGLAFIEDVYKPAQVATESATVLLKEAKDIAHEQRITQQYINELFKQITGKDVTLPQVPIEAQKPLQ